jgi:antibiotic biosynthesis monooxygenase (ABM) superfamily enzyme
VSGEIAMIARHWRGWTKPEHADRYEEFLKEKILPSLYKIDGYRGGYILRRDDNEEVEFVVINLFDSLDSVRKFAGNDYETAVFEPEALTMLSRKEPKAIHYEVKAEPVVFENKSPSP